MADDTPLRATPLEGVTTVDEKLTFEPERLTYAALRQVAAEIVASAGEHLAGRQVVVADQAFLADLGNLAAARLQLDMLARDYRHISASLGRAAEPGGEPEAVPEVAILGGAAVAGLATGLQGALGLVSLLRQDVEVRGVPVRIDARAVDVAVAGALRASDHAVLVPGLTAIRAPLDTAGSVQERWRDVQQARHDAWAAVGPLVAQLGRKDAELDAATRAGASESQVAALARELFELRKQVEPLTEPLGQADRRLADLQAEWDKVHETSGLSTLARLLLAEVIEAQHPLYLHVAVVASGGHHRVTRHLLRTLFGGDGLSAMGGVVARWAVLGPDGAFIRGGLRAARRAARFPKTDAVGDGWGRPEP